ncbi:nucleoside phosphorylase domain-containing protein [Aspergillus spectabilis]
MIVRVILEALASRELYTVGWIAALPLEHYTWGRIGEHNVVIASLAAGKYGTTSAAATALPMLASFPQIRIGLLMGIGASISRPDKGRDIRLGDVAVSQPHGNSGGREGVAFLNSPREVLLHALANIQGAHELETPKMLEYLKEAIARYPRLAKMLLTEIILEHIGDECTCIEMEAAGLMNNDPCIVIRGICDYADAHKSDRWQRYCCNGGCICKGASCFCSLSRPPEDAKGY